MSQSHLFSNEWHLSDNLRKLAFGSFQLGEADNCIDKYMLLYKYITIPWILQNPSE